MICFAHIIDDNLGDVHCCPNNYLSFKEGYEIDFRDLDLKNNDPIIIGGGGMLYPEVDKWIYEVSKVRKAITWGIGLNYSKEFHSEIIRKFLSKCELVGLRDKEFAVSNGFEFVPCVSCLSTEFNDNPEPVEEIGVYEHLHNPIPIFGIPKMSNLADKKLKSAIDFLKRFKKIITNSYHGAFWSKLLKREVEIYKPFSSRFNDIPNESLIECRNLNYMFYDKVKKLL